MSSVTKRLAFGMYPKYELITSHTMRRSFATNYFGKIETPILMEITGHFRESTFLSYIGENPNKDAVADVFMERLRRLGNEGWRCLNQFKNSGILKISWPFHGSLKVYESLTTENQLVKIYLRLQSEVFSKK